MALLGAFVYTAFQDAVASQALAAATGKRRRGAPPPPAVGGLEEWMCVRGCGVVNCVGGLGG